MVEPVVPTKYGKRKIGEEEFEKQMAQKQLESRGGTVYGSRKGGGGSNDYEKLHNQLHELTVGEAKELIAKLEKPERVGILHAVEQENPSHEGGRKGVLDALEERLGELGVELQKQESEDEGPDLDAIRAELEENPDNLDEIIEAELGSGEPRPAVVALLLEFEVEKGDEARAEVLELLNNAASEE